MILCPWNCAVGSSWARVVFAVDCILSGGLTSGWGIHSVGRLY
jgi:hypothetical protein